MDVSSLAGCRTRAAEQSLHAHGLQTGAAGVRSAVEALSFAAAALARLAARRHLEIAEHFAGTRLERARELLEAPARSLGRPAPLDRLERIASDSEAGIHPHCLLPSEHEP